MSPAQEDKNGKKKESDCTKLAQAQMFVQESDNMFGLNWVEILCYPYILCGKIWECCVGICASTNICLLCWLILQFIMCKLSMAGSPDPVLFPYYFYIFCQVTIMSLVFVCIWLFFGKPVVYPYMLAIYNNLMDVPASNRSGGRRMALRRYCFKKSEIFEAAGAGGEVAGAGGEAVGAAGAAAAACAALHVYLYDQYK